MAEESPVVYHGHRFRNRTEAQWAVFFEALGLPYRYEEEASDLRGTAYRGDFWLTQQEIFIEVLEEQPAEEELQRAARLCLTSQKPVHLFVGEPYFNETVASFRFVGAATPATSAMVSNESGYVEDIHPCLWNYRSDGQLELHPLETNDQRVFLCETEEGIAQSRILAASIAARQAQFEPD